MYRYSRSFGTSAKAGKKCIGVVKEVYNQWERRVPLNPKHVNDLVKAGIQVLVEPSNKRIYTNDQYSLAGATLTDDLSPANLIVGVKQVPEENLIPNKTYMFFSHTIKAQPENMDLLDEILKKNIRMIDYECITEQGLQNGRRLIAFGSYAGRAGMINGFRGLGERLIKKGYSSSFLNIGSAYMYGNLDLAKEAVEHAGNHIRQHGLPEDIAPMTFVFTGNGNVSKGAQEIFRLMPHQMVHPSELPNLPKDRHTLYGCVVQEDFMAQKLNSSAPFDRQDYYANPHTYEPIFHKKILPHTSMLINGMYWDERFPRLITKDQMQHLHVQGTSKLLGIADISCDIGGSIEFLTHSTEIEQPFYFYDCKTKSVSNLDEECTNDSIMMMGVDILPSELPSESSKFFGDHLFPYLNFLSGTDASKPLDTTATHSSSYPTELLGGIIASNGKLQPKYEYINQMRMDKERSKKIQFATKKDEIAGSTCIQLDGHLFDTSFINKVFDLIELNHGGFHLVSCHVCPNFNDSGRNISTAIVQMSMANRHELDKMIADINELAASMPNVEACIIELPDHCGENYDKTLTQYRDRLQKRHQVENIRQKEGASMSFHSSIGSNVTVRDNKTEHNEIVCFGAGLVATPLVEYLTRDHNNKVIVVSGVEGESDKLRAKLSGRNNISSQTLDVVKNGDKIHELCKTSTCVVSLLPATMHVDIAKSCIKHKTPLVTASYISPEMKELHEQAQKANIPILCELGLDPGMDHMSAMRVIDEVKARNGSIFSFKSVCGGLPAPEAADNPIAYKFSWSPRGVLTAALNSAQYRENDILIQIEGSQLLNNASKVNFLPAFALEQLPNRNSLPYADIYGIPNAATIYRGTLRYAGNSKIMYQCRQLGLLDVDTTNELPVYWHELINQLLHDRKNHLKLEEDAMGFLTWLGMFDMDHKIPVNTRSNMDAFCALLSSKLSYQPGERDMAIMHHEFGVIDASGKKELITSTFVGYGSEQGDTIMAKTVGMTAAIGLDLILKGQVANTGVLTPTTPDIYIPGLQKLEQEGIHFKEQSLPFRNLSSR